MFWKLTFGFLAFDNLAFDADILDYCLENSVSCEIYFWGDSKKQKALLNWIPSVFKGWLFGHLSNYVIIAKLRPNMAKHRDTNHFGHGGHIKNSTGLIEFSVSSLKEIQNIHNYCGQCDRVCESRRSLISRTNNSFHVQMAMFTTSDHYLKNFI